MLARAAYLLLAATLLIHGFLFWKARRLIAEGYPDFTIFYSAGLIVRHGLGEHLYEGPLQYRVQRGFASEVEIRHGPLPYNHPPFEALIFAPLTLLSYRAAYAIWNFLNLGMLSAVPLVLRPYFTILRRKWIFLWILGLFAFFPVFAALLQGQDVILLLLLESLAFSALIRESDFRSGCWLGLGGFRIHLVLPLVLVISLGWKRPRVFLGFLATCLCLGGASVAIVGWDQVLHYPVSVLHMERIVEQAAMVCNMPNLRGLFEGWRASARWSDGLRAITLFLSTFLLAALIAASRSHTERRTDLRFAIATVATVLISYHAFAHDLVLLVFPLLAVLSLWAEDEFRWSYPLLLMPGGLLILTPLYLLLGLRLKHLNLLALILLLWMVGLHRSNHGNSNLQPGAAE
jgi:hypothetical protein